MSFDLKVSLKQRAELSAQQKKLNRLIDKIEQQKISLATWQNAQAEIQQHTRKKLMPVYSELHDVLFQQLDQLWMLLQQHEFSKAEMQQLDEKIAQLAQMLKRSQMLTAEQIKLVKQIDTFYQQHAQQSVKQNKKVQSVKFELNENFDQKITIFSNFEKWGIFSGFYGTNTEILPLFLNSDPEKSQIFPSDILGVQLEWKSPK